MKFQTVTDDYWVTEFNFLQEFRDGYDYPERVEIYETSLREVDQTPGAVLRYDEKIELARDLDQLGVDKIEIFPIVSKDDAKALTEIGNMGLRLKTSGLARTVPSDIDIVADCNTHTIMIEGVGNLLRNYKTEDELIHAFTSSIKYAKSLGIQHVLAGPWDIGKSTIPLMEKLYKSCADAGADSVLFADSMGYTAPWIVTKLVKKIREWVGASVKIECHFHNNYGLALANSISAVVGGATSIHCTFNNLGERTGNASTDEVSMALKLILGVETNIKLDLLYPFARKIETMTKIPIHKAKPVVGDRLFEAGSGLVVDLLNKLQTPERQTMCTPFNPKLIGRPGGTKILWGKGVGSNMVARKIEDLGFTANNNQIRNIREGIKAQSLIRKDILPEFEVENIIKAEIRKS